MRNVTIRIGSAPPRRDERVATVGIQMPVYVLKSLAQHLRENPIPAIKVETQGIVRELLEATDRIVDREGSKA